MSKFLDKFIRDVEESDEAYEKGEFVECRDRKGREKLFEKL